MLKYSTEKRTFSLLLQFLNHPLRFLFTEFEYWFVFLNDSGDTDAVLPITSTRYSVDALKLPVIGSWRPWYDGGQVKSLFAVYTLSNGILKLYLVSFRIYVILTCHLLYSC